MSQLSNLYLFAYNSLQAFGWVISLFRVLSSFASTKSFQGAYASAGDLICLLQTVSFLEVLHGAIGLVPSGVLLPLMQWGGRTHFLLAIVSQIVEVQDLPSVFITFLAWSLVWLMYDALPFIKKNNLYADFFSSFHFSYYSFVKVLLVCYPFLWLKLYLHLFKQRRSKLGKLHRKKKN
ncbi:PREDICTED: very-long-chain (3R)-3-hydroxyacyl-CoA dehydratase 2 isoform X2 [Nelumbo nucifera]|uniref:Very-long-chain (3R)-3-hydroxyacyl-CoA dehydratase n=2 Tax=Nelumbo nucifera TaxID=4432 RepID=A0A822Y3Y0_NELNU|nr:PREDICTED: very-long-chain (3R)-3-hydroxyacyl-CoA dehydratase 2 isoform X2 [Nelumbo nucifera]DAD25926.1 TPA_asm: hypothetical protein HUJ06_027394 [Nelumbo nucifera]